MLKPLKIEGMSIFVLVWLGQLVSVLGSSLRNFVQGRVFSLNSAICGSCLPLAYLVAGPLSDRIFEPLMTVNGSLAGTIGQVIGTGPGRGMIMAFRVPKCLHLGGKSGVESEQISSEAIIFRSVWHLDSQWESFSTDPK